MHQFPPLRGVWSVKSVENEKQQQPPCKKRNTAPLCTRPSYDAGTSNHSLSHNSHYATDRCSSFSRLMPNLRFSSSSSGISKDSDQRWPKHHAVDATVLNIHVVCISSEIRFQSADVSKADCTSIIDLFSAPSCPAMLRCSRVVAVCTLAELSTYDVIEHPILFAPSKQWSLPMP